MTSVDWFLVTLLTVNAIATISLIGKPRRPLTPGVAVLAVAIDTAIVVAIVLSAR